MDNPLQNLNLKWWYTVLLTTSFLVFVLSITVELQEVDNASLQFLSSGVFFIALANFAGLRVKQSIYRSPDIKGVVEREEYEFNFPSAVMYVAGTYLLFRGIF